MGTSISHRKALALVERYLRVSKSWDARRDSDLRSHMRECRECAATYDRAVTIHRMLVSADSMLPSAFERQRMMDATLERSTGLRPIPTPGPAWLRFGTLSAIGAVAIALLILRPAVLPTGLGQWGEETAEEDYIGARGTGFHDLNVGFGLSGVTRSEQEYEIVAKGTYGYLDDWMRISTTRVVDDYSYVFIFGLQDGRSPIWYYPDPSHEDGLSQPAPFGTAIALGAPGDAFEFKLSERHVDGALTVVAIFSRTPLELSEVEEAVKGHGAPILDEPAIAVGYGQFASDALIRILEVTLVPGSREDVDGHR